MNGKKKNDNVPFFVHLIQIYVGLSSTRTNNVLFSSYPRPPCFADNLKQNYVALLSYGTNNVPFFIISNKMEELFIISIISKKKKPPYI